MSELTATRTLVKSPPELWAQCSDAESLGRHLHAFGEIRITRLEPETTVAWEGERASGTVRIEPSGWGTKVTLTADPREAQPEPLEVPAPLAPPAPPAPPAPEVAPAVVAAEVAVAPAPGPARRRGGILGWLFGRGPAGRPVAVEPQPPVSPPPVSPPPVSPPPVSSSPVSPPAVSSFSSPSASSPAVELEPAISSPAEAAGTATVECPSAPLDADAALGAALASLGQAHHRPFSRT